MLPLDGWNAPSASQAEHDAAADDDLHWLSKSDIESNFHGLIVMTAGGAGNIL